MCKPVQAEGGLHSNEGQLLPCHETEVYKAVQTELGAGAWDNTEVKKLYELEGTRDSDFTELYEQEAACTHTWGQY